MENKQESGELINFYNGFMKKYGVTEKEVEKGVKKSIPFPVELWQEIFKKFNDFQTMGQGATDEGYFVKNILGVYDDEAQYGCRCNILAVPFWKLTDETKENLQKFYEAYKCYEKKYKYNTFWINDYNKISFDPKTMNSFMIVDTKGNGKCYYEDGYVNPVRNGQTFPKEGKQIGMNNFNVIKNAVKKYDFEFINKHYCQSNLCQLPRTNMQTINNIYTFGQWK